MKALVLGCTGQDGSYLCEQLVAEGAETHGMIRRTSMDNTGNLRGILDRMVLHQGDLADTLSVRRIVGEVQPDEIYNMADQDNAGWSYQLPEYAAQITGGAVASLLEIVRTVAPKARVLQPISTHCFASGVVTPESTLAPMSPYACAKAYALLLSRFYRSAYKMHVTCCIFTNHESPRRHEQYLSRKITTSVARMATGQCDPGFKLHLGVTTLPIDFGYAPDFMEASVLALRYERPCDFVVATGETHTARDWLAIAFERANIVDWHDRFVEDQALLRPASTGALSPDPSDTMVRLGWSPRTSFQRMVGTMVDHDVLLAEKNMSPVT